jgi:hypothetical protein
MVMDREEKARSILTDRPAEVSCFASELPPSEDVSIEARELPCGALCRPLPS